jgi:hypothetical protein
MQRQHQASKPAASSSPASELVRRRRRPQIIEEGEQARP